MLYGIGVIVALAFIGLVVLNMRAGRPPKVPVQSEKTKGAAVNERSQLPAAAPSTPGVPAAEVPDTVSRTAEDGDDLKPPPARREEPKPAATASRKPPVNSMNWEHSDDQYRQALRSFSEPDAQAAGEDKGASKVQSKDEAYREALRSLSKPK